MKDSEKNSFELFQDLIFELEVLLDGLHRHHIQRSKKIAHTIRKDLTEEDILNPDNFKDIMRDPNFMYEDGMAAGALSAKMAVISFLKEKL